MLLSFVKSSKKMAIGLAAAAVVVVGAGAGTAYALITNSTGTFSDRQYFATNDVAYTVPAATPSGTWVNVPGMVRTISVPANTRRLVDARFTAESMCTGGSWCSVRIVVVNSAGAVTQLYPQSGTDFAFDSPSADLWESNAIERNSRTFLPTGTYRVYVQAAKVGSPTFRLDDMHLAVEAVRP
ncbi:MAG TPA: hypothetical protein VK674_05505 [Candidatus Limnocylindria bacterium]|nr:hypothetical protein [Candidatus Limnocylindria bacterium]